MSISRPPHRESARRRNGRNSAPALLLEPLFLIHDLGGFELLPRPSPGQSRNRCRQKEVPVMSEKHHGSHWLEREDVGAVTVARLKTGKVLDEDVVRTVFGQASSLVT